MGLVWLSTVPLTNGTVATIFGVPVRSDDWRWLGALAAAALLAATWLGYRDPAMWLALFERAMMCW